MNHPLLSCLGILLAITATSASCSSDRPPLEKPAPQAHTVKSFVDEVVSSSAQSATLSHGAHVFLDHDARQTLSATKTAVPVLRCEGAGEEADCTASLPAQLAGSPALIVAGSANPTPIEHAAAAAHAEDGTMARAAARSPRSRAAVIGTSGTVALGPLTAAEREATRVHPAPRLAERTVTVAPLAVPSGARLRFAVGVEEVAWWIDSAPLVFRIVAEEPDGTAHDLYRRTVDPARQPEDRRWMDEDVDLGHLRGMTVRLRFITEPAREGDLRPSLPLWGEPRLIAPAVRRRPSVVLISLDTLRAKSMSLYGYTRETTPNLTALAARGAVFDNASTTFPNTLPSHMSMMTGLYPVTHGVTTTYGVSELRASDRLLAEMFQAAGYATAAFTEDGLLDARYGFRRGFARYYENTSVETGFGDAVETFGRALDWVQQRNDEAFFLFVHTYQVHDPYTPPPPYDALFLDDELAGTAERRAYEQEIRYLDDLVQNLVDRLHQLVPADQLLLVVTADHGEEFWEHHFAHHAQLFDEVMHIPMVMVWPGKIPSGLHIQPPVSLVDVAPTILGLVGVDTPSAFEGLNLVDLVAGRTTTLERDTVLGESPTSPVASEVRFVARTANVKCLLTPSGKDDRCYDLQADPAEQHPRAVRDDVRFVRPTQLADGYRRRAMARMARAKERSRALVARLRSAASERHDAPGATEAAPAAPAAPQSDAIQQKLRALGYVQ